MPRAAGHLANRATVVVGARPIGVAHQEHRAQLDRDRIHAATHSDPVDQRRRIGDIAGEVQQACMDKIALPVTLAPAVCAEFDAKSAQ